MARLEIARSRLPEAGVTPEVRMFTDLFRLVADYGWRPRR
jgi:hypothetical protein